MLCSISLSVSAAGHKALLDDLEREMDETGTLRNLATSPEAPASLAKAYAGACEALERLRAFHLGVATHYLRRALTGTGGSDFRSLLDEGVRSTRRAARE